jgi:hypothetical protein
VEIKYFCFRGVYSMSVAGLHGVERQVIESMRKETVFSIDTMMKRSLGGSEENHKKSQKDLCPYRDYISE